MCLVVLFFCPAADFGGMCFMERWPCTAVVVAFGVGSCNFGGDGGHLSHAINPPCCGKKGGGHKNRARK